MTNHRGGILTMKSCPPTAVRMPFRRERGAAARRIAPAPGSPSRSVAAALGRIAGTTRIPQGVATVDNSRSLP